jgi:hypothetical protein
VEVLSDAPQLASNALAFDQAVGLQYTLNIEVVDTLTLIHAVDLRGPLYQPVGQNLNLVEGEIGHKNPNHQFGVDILQFSQFLGRIVPISVSQMLSLVDEGRRITRIGQVLSLIQDIVVGKGGAVTQLFTFTELASKLAEFSRPVSQTLALIQSVTYRFEDGGCIKKTYVPYVGNSDGEYTPPSTTSPTLSTGTLTLTYPYVSPTLTLVLHNPEFSDRDVLNFNRINRETRGGTLVVFADPTWPKTQTLSLQVDNLSQSKAQALVTFLETSLGKKVGLLDWEGRQWSGLIVTPDATITHVKRGDRSVEFDFQGSLE